MKKVTDSELKLYYIVKGSGGSFETKLFELICSADKFNQTNLSLAYPEFTSAVIRYQNERGYWEDLCKRLGKSS